MNAVLSFRHAHTHAAREVYIPFLVLPPRAALLMTYNGVLKVARRLLIFQKFPGRSLCSGWHRPRSASRFYPYELSYLDRAPSVSRGPVQTPPSHARTHASPHHTRAFTYVDATMPVNNTLYLILSFIAVFSVPVISFVKKMTGQLANGPKVVAGTNYGGKAGSYTKDGVSKHKTQDDLWLIIDGAVYDVTEYVDEHPGGVAAIMKNAGGDASEGFHGPQHPSRVMDIVDEYKIGTLVEAAKDK